MATRLPLVRGSGRHRQLPSGDAVPVAAGGTGAVTAAAARANLGLKSAAVADILGVVSQSSGAATGSIIERGSNANGRYVRFADGTQICWGVSTGRATASTQAGSAGYHTGLGNLTYPAAFVGDLPAYIPYTVSPQSYYGAALYDSVGTLTATPNTYVWSPSNSFSAAVTYIAIGRWF